MSQRAKDLSHKLQKVGDELTDMVRQLSDEDWKKVLPIEQWPVGAALHHVAAGHLGITSLARMILNGEQLPEISMEGLKDMANRHAREHADCTKEEVLEILAGSLAEIVSFAAGLDDDELDRTGYLAATGDVSVQQIIEYVVFMSAGEHIANIKNTLNIT